MIRMDEEKCVDDITVLQRLILYMWDYNVDGVVSVTKAVFVQSRGIDRLQYLCRVKARGIVSAYLSSSDHQASLWAVPGLERLVLGQV